MTGRWLVGMLCVVTLLHGGVFVLHAVRLAEPLASTNRLLDPQAGPPPPELAAIAAQRALPRIAARIPAGARVLLVTGVPWPVQYQLYFLPRPFTYLQRVPDGLVERVAAVAPDLGARAALELEEMERRGLRWTARRMAAELGAAEYLVEFFEGVPLPGDAPALELVEQVEVARLYRVVRGP